MNLEKKLSKLGIRKTEELNYEEVNYIAHYITNLITNTFGILKLQYNEILAKLLNCKMYYAKIDTNISKVNYVYEDNSVYIDECINIYEPQEQLIHELIHYLQVVRKEDKKIQKIGLCRLNEFSITGLGINEAIVQYMSAKIMGNERKEIQIQEIKIKTISPNSYTLLTNLMEQLIYLLGEKLIIEGALNINEDFEDKMLNTFEEKTTQILKNFDKILELKNKAIIEEKETLNEEIKIFIETQNLMVKKYYERTASMMSTIKEIDICTEKFLNNEKYLAKQIQEEYTQYNSYFEEIKPVIMNKFDKQLIKISRANQKNALILYNNKIKALLRKVISYLLH